MVERYQAPALLNARVAIVFLRWPNEHVTSKLLKATGQNPRTTNLERKKNKLV